MYRRGRRPDARGDGRRCGAQFERTVVEDGTATVVAAVRTDRPVSEFATAVESQFENATVSTVWTDPQRGVGTDDAFAELTDKRTTLRHAYHEGYFVRAAAWGQRYRNCRPGWDQSTDVHPTPSFRPTEGVRKLAD